MGLTQGTFNLLQRYNIKHLYTNKLLESTKKKKKGRKKHHMHLFTELLHIASEPVCFGTLLFTLASPLYQIRALSTAYHIIPPTKASGAHGASLRAAETRKCFCACLPAVRPNTLLHRVGVV